MSIYNRTRLTGPLEIGTHPLIGACPYFYRVIHNVGDV